MTRPVFRPIPFWQSALMVLPDSAFFDLMRNALGNIKTPFNKQRLLDDLGVFLMRPELQETIAALLDEDDRRIIAAIALLGEPPPNDLEQFFAGDFTGASLYETLLGLEERLVVYRFREEDQSRLALNPRLEPVLAPIAANSSSLFPVLSAPLPVTGAKQSESDVLDDRTLAAVFAFLLSGERFFRTDESSAAGAEAPASGLILRKKALDEGKRLFPGLDLETLAGGIVALGLILRNGERFRTDNTRLAAFREISREMRAAYLASGMALYLRGCDPASSVRSAGLPPFYTGRGLLRNVAFLIRRLIDSLGGLDAARGTEDRVYPRTTLIKLTEILRREEKSTWDFTGEIPQTSFILTAAEKAGLLSGGPSAYRLPPPFLQEESAAPVIAFDSPFSFVMYPGIPFAGALDLALSCDLEETGTAPRFSLSRDSVARCFDQGGSAAELWEQLDRLSCGRAGENLKYNIEDWERRYHEVTLDEGVIVTLSGERAYLAERGPLARIVRRTLAPAEKERPGVYLLAVANREDAASVLRDAGVDIFAVPVSSASASTFRLGEYIFPRFVQASAKNTDVHALYPESSSSSPATAFDAEKADRILEDFRKALDGMKMERQDKEALRERIERRMIVSAAQLTPSNFRFEKREARALDYAGKTVIARQALASGSLLEVIWPSCGPSGVVGRAEGLEKKGGESVLVFRPRDSSAETLRIPLGKISLMRLIKQSIFGE
jgi:hypothetical protein